MNKMVAVEIALKAIEIAYWNEDLKEAIRLINENAIQIDSEPKENNSNT